MPMESIPLVSESFIKTVFPLSFKTSINIDIGNTCGLHFAPQIPTFSLYFHTPRIGLLSLHGSKKPSRCKKEVPLQLHYQLCMSAWFCASTLQGVTDSYSKLHENLV